MTVVQLLVLCGVIKLSASSDKPPLYPLIGEVAIDKKNVLVFKSSWDKNNMQFGQDFEKLKALSPESS